PPPGSTAFLRSPRSGGKVWCLRGRDRSQAYQLDRPRDAPLPARLVTSPNGGRGANGPTSRGPQWNNETQALMPSDGPQRLRAQRDREVFAPVGVTGVTAVGRYWTISLKVAGAQRYCTEEPVTCGSTPCGNKPSVTL